jgi:hypothetical protein
MIILSDYAYHLRPFKTIFAGKELNNSLNVC